jgi:hypothetical protein
MHILHRLHRAIARMSWRVSRRLAGLSQLRWPPQLAQRLHLMGRGYEIFVRGASTVASGFRLYIAFGRMAGSKLLTDRPLISLLCAQGSDQMFAVYPRIRKADASLAIASEPEGCGPSCADA